MSRNRIAISVALAVLPIVLALWLAGFDVSYQLGNYVSTDNAFVAGDVYQASAPTAGQISDVLLEVGDTVEKGQGVANLLTLAPSLAARGSMHVRSPMPGTLVQMSVVRGQSVTAGQSIATVADLNNLWVVAYIDEVALKDVRTGMSAEVRVKALDRAFPGRVLAAMPDLSSAQAAAQRAAPGTSVRPIPQVPVRIAFDYEGAALFPGMTATARIFTR